jgi:hypothetical protein
MAPYTSPVPVPPPAQSSGHRGLYMTLGALIVLAVLVVAGIYVPRSSRTHAKSPDPNTAPENSMASTANQSPATDTASSQNTPVAPQTPAQSSQPASGGTAPPAASVDSSNAMQPHEMPPAAAAMKASPGTGDVSQGKSNHVRARKLTGQTDGTPGEAPESSQARDAAPASSGPADSAQLDELEKTVDQISNRAAAVNSSLERLQQQQAASGYGLRGDMVEKQASLKSNLFKAEEALQHGDVARTKKYADLASADADVLERFLGH